MKIARPALTTCVSVVLSLSASLALAAPDPDPAPPPASAPASAPATLPSTVPALPPPLPPLPKPPPKAEIMAVFKTGLILTTGNAQSAAATGTFSFGYKLARHKVGVEAGIAYVRTGILLAIDDDVAPAPGAGTIEEDEITRDSKIASAAFFVKGRYDFFLTERLSLFAAGVFGGDRPAGKVYYVTGQLGVSYKIVKTEKHELVGELGYDFTMERYVEPSELNLVHSIRAFLGYTLKVSTDTGLYANVEALFNLHNENVPTADGSNVAGPFEDTRLIGKAGLTTKLFKRLGFSFGFTAKFDNVPAPLPPFALPYAAGFVPLAEKLDTITEAALTYTLF